MIYGYARIDERDVGKDNQREWLHQKIKTKFVYVEEVFNHKRATRTVWSKLKAKLELGDSVHIKSVDLLGYPLYIAKKEIEFLRDKGVALYIGDTVLLEPNEYNLAIEIITTADRVARERKAKEKVRRQNSGRKPADGLREFIKECHQNGMSSPLAMARLSNGEFTRNQISKQRKGMLGRGEIK